MRITTLMENCGSEHKALVHEHGLSFFIEQNGCRLLFDCGSGESTIQNAEKLGIDLNKLDAVILSHNHYDHAAGYKDLIKIGGICQTLYTGQDFLSKKYASSDHLKYCNLSSGINESFLKKYSISHKSVRSLEEIFPGIYVVSDFKRTHSFEQIPERFVKETKNGFIQDTFSDEVALVFRTSKGLIVLVGCSHPGILNMLNTINERLNQRIYAIISRNPERL